MLVPDPEYPLDIERKKDGHDGASGLPSESSVYNEDGSLEVCHSFLSLTFLRPSWTMNKHVMPDSRSARAMLFNS